MTTGPMEDGSVAGGLQGCGRQCENGHYRATLRHLSILALGVWFEWMVSVGPKAFHYNGHCLL
jgi:hypothetical protein